MHKRSGSLSAPIEEVSPPIEEVNGAGPGDFDDKELVLAFKRGEDGSYQAIYSRYLPRVQGICRGMLDHAHDAEEAQQETFMRVFTSLPNFNGRYQLGAWVSRIATNVCLDHIRSTSRKPADSTDQIELVGLSNESGDRPEEVFFRADERQRVRSVLARLAPTHRAALALREFEGMSYAEIAVALRMTEPQVKALIHRARRSFKKQWAHGLAFLLPWRLLARLRRFSHHYDAPPQLADAAASTANLASSCSAVLHQCGAFVTDKAAGAFTALIVGTAAVGVVVSPAPQARPEKRDAVEIVRAEPQRDARRVPASKEKGRSKPKKTKRTEQAPAAAEPQPESEPTPPAEEEPQESPESVPPTEKGGTAQPPVTQPPVTSTPPPLYTYFGWDRGQPIPRAQATSQSTKLDCAARTLNHRVDTLISDGAFSYRAVFEFIAAPVNSRVGFTVWKDNVEYRYSSWGDAPTVVWSESGSQTRLEITGEYGALHGSDTEKGNLPASGHFDAMLTLDCTALSVVTESAVFTAE